MVLAKVWKLAQRPHGEPRVEDFLCVEEDLPACVEGGEGVNELMLFTPTIFM